MTRQNSTRSDHHTGPGTLGGPFLAMNDSTQTISIHPDYVLVERPVDYEVVLDEQLQALEELSARCRSAGCNKVLVIGPRSYIRLSAFDFLELGREIAERKLQFAFAELHDASDDAVVLLESVVANHGGAARFFDCVEDARAWLKTDGGK